MAGWTEPFHGVSHLMIDRLQYTIADYGRFCELMVFSWAAYNVVGQHYFFREPWTEGCVTDKHYHWGCGDEYIDRAKEWVAQGRS